MSFYQIISRSIVSAIAIFIWLDRNQILIPFIESINQRQNILANLQRVSHTDYARTRAFKRNARCSNFRQSQISFLHSKFPSENLSFFYLKFLSTIRCSITDEQLFDSRSRNNGNFARCARRAFYAIPAR